MMILMINQPTSTAFCMKNNFWTKISKNGHCDPAVDRYPHEPQWEEIISEVAFVHDVQIASHISLDSCLSVFLSLSVLFALSLSQTLFCSLVSDTYQVVI